MHLPIVQATRPVRRDYDRKFYCRIKIVMMFSIFQLKSWWSEISQITPAHSPGITASEERCPGGWTLWMHVVPTIVLSDLDEHWKIQMFKATFRKDIMPASITIQWMIKWKFLFFVLGILDGGCASTILDLDEHFECSEGYFGWTWKYLLKDLDQHHECSDEHSYVLHNQEKMTNHLSKTTPSLAYLPRWTWSRHREWFECCCFEFMYFGESICLTRWKLSGKLTMMIFVDEYI